MNTPRAENAGANTTHLPARPVWSCAGCSKPWPCPSHKDRLLAEYGADDLSLAFYLAASLVDAVHDLPDVPASDLYTRFLGWLRNRNTCHG